VKQTYAVNVARIHFLWELIEGGLAVTLSVEGAEKILSSVALPGAFAPESQALQLGLPVMQGLLFDGRGGAFEETLGYGGHFALSMAMLGYLSGRYRPVSA
jgi:hypothetical protein